MYRFLVLFLVFSVASVASAGEVFIPATYRGDGAAGSDWRTEIVVANVSSLMLLEPVRVNVTLHRENAEPQTMPLLLATNEVYAVPDALRDWFSLESGGGLIRVSWDEPNAKIAARARIYNVSSGGEYGQGVPSFRADQLESIVHLPGLTGVNGNRTNIGISNPHDIDLLAWIMLYDTSGASRGGFTVMVPARSFRQYNDIFSHFQAGPLNAAMIQVSSGNATLYAYASIVRDDTGDATFVPPAR